MWLVCIEYKYVTEITLQRKIPSWPLGLQYKNKRKEVLYLYNCNDNFWRQTNLLKEVLDDEYVTYIFLFPHKEVIVLLILFLYCGLNSGKQRAVLSSLILLVISITPQCKHRHLIYKHFLTPSLQLNCNYQISECAQWTLYECYKWSKF